MLISLKKGFLTGFICCLLYCLSVYLHQKWFAAVNPPGFLPELFYHLGTGTLFAGIAAIVGRQLNRLIIANRTATETMAQLTSLSDHLPGSFIYQGWKNPQGYAEILYISKGISAYSNASVEEIKKDSRIITNLIFEEDRLRYYAAVAETGTRFIPIDMDVRVKNLNGITRYCNIHSIPRQREDGVWVWDSLFTDVTNRKKLEEELRQQQVYNQRLLTELIITGYEKEKSEIAHALHEDINQVLSAARLCLESSAYRNLSSDLQHDCSSYLKEAVTKINRLFTYLQIPAFQELGFTAALEQLKDTICHGTGAIIHLQYAAYDWDTLAEPTKLLLYRILSGRLENCVSKKNGMPVLVKLQVRAHDLHMIITDSTEWDSKKEKEEEQYNLSILQSRIEFYRGKVEMQYPERTLRRMKISLPLVLGPR